MVLGPLWRCQYRVLEQVCDNEGHDMPCCCFLQHKQQWKLEMEEIRNMDTWE